MSAFLYMWGLPGGASITSNLFSYNWDVTDSVFGRYNSHVPHKHFSITRKPDKYSTLLFQLSASGGYIDLIKISLTYTDDEGWPAKGGLLFSDNMIASMHMSGSGKTVETINVSYGSFTQEY